MLVFFFWPSSCPTMVSNHKDTVEGPVHHSSRRTKLLWKQWTRHKFIQCTSAEKKACSKIVKTSKLEYNIAVQALHNIIYQEAVALQAKFGVHSMEWYHKDLLQVSSKKAPCKVSGWNVFLHKQSKLINNGMSSYSMKVTVLTILRAFRQEDYIWIVRWYCRDMA